LSSPNKTLSKLLRTVMDDFDESLPSHSVFVPASVPKEQREDDSFSDRSKPHDNAYVTDSRTDDQRGVSIGHSRQETHTKSPKPVTPKPFLRKGSRQEPSALMRKNAKRTQTSNLSESKIRRSRASSTQSGSICEDTSFSTIQYGCSPERPTSAREKGAGDVDISVVSSTTSVLGDTSTIELHQRVMQKQQHARRELDEFEMIERDLDRIEINPLMMSLDTKGQSEVQTGNYAAATTSVRDPVDRYESSDSGYEKGDWQDQTADYYMSEPPLMLHSEEVDTVHEDDEYGVLPKTSSEPTVRQSREQYDWRGSEGRKSLESLNRKIRLSVESDTALTETSQHRNACTTDIRSTSPMESKTTEASHIIPQYESEDEESYNNDNEYHPEDDKSEGSRDALPNSTEFYDMQRTDTSVAGVMRARADDESSVDDSHSWGATERVVQTTRPSMMPYREEAGRYNYTTQSQHSVGAIGGDRGAEDPWSVRKSVGSVRRAASAGRAVRPASAGAVSSRRKSFGKSGEVKGRDRVGNGNSSLPEASGQSVSEDLKRKAKELEDEINTYKKENSNLKSVRKQQENVLADIQEQRSQLKAWVDEEKRKTEKWCEEIKEAALKEKRAAAKYARDVRTSTSSGLGGTTRKERAEIEALKATVEKLKIDHAEATKKWKTNTTRLQKLTKSQAAMISDLEEQVASLELEKLRHWESVNSANTTSNKQSRKGRRILSRDGTPESSYVEEVELDNSAHIIRNSKISTTRSITNKDGSVVSSSVEHVRRSSNREALDVQLSEERASEGSLVEYGTLRKMNVAGGVDNDFVWNTTETESNNITYDSGEDVTAVTPSNSHTSPRLRPSGELSSPHNRSYDPKKYNRSREDNLGTSSGNRKSTGSSVKELNMTASTTVLSPGRVERSNDAPLHEKRVSEPSQSNLQQSESLNSAYQTERVVKLPDSDGRRKSKDKDRVVEITPEGVKITKYSNGTVKTAFPDGSSEVRFSNGDIKNQDPHEGIVVYFYAHAKTTHTTYKDGSELYEFPNGQIERHFVNGRKVITFPDKTIKTIDPDGFQESIFPDGVIVKEYPGGERQIVKS